VFEDYIFVGAEPCPYTSVAAVEPELKFGPTYVSRQPSPN
jgi:hypothetical protein